jgi:hypothetical protein
MSWRTGELNAVLVFCRLEGDLVRLLDINTILTQLGSSGHLSTICHENPSRYTVSGFA